MIRTLFRPKGGNRSAAEASYQAAEFSLPSIVRLIDVVLALERA